MTTRTFVYFKDLKETAITDGGVFAVMVRPLMNKQGAFREILLELIEQEGNGDIWRHLFINKGDASVPVQVELLLMDIECLPTWFWHEQDGVYYGQFALWRNVKCDPVFSAETKGFPILL